MEEYWKDKQYAFFCHKECEYFPCHPTKNPDQFNCLFCYCPLYALGRDCGGNFVYNEKGYKDCSDCMSERFGLIGLESVEHRYLDGRAVSNCGEATSAEIDQEVMGWRNGRRVRRAVLRSSRIL